VPFLYSCGSDYNGMYAGQGVALIKQQFAAARKHKRAIIFIDEVIYEVLCTSVYDIIQKQQWNRNAVVIGIHYA
jgi:hypothetical protein